MKEFIFFFRQPSYDYSKTPPDEMQAIAKKWQHWLGGISKLGKLSTPGPRIGSEGKVVKADGAVTDGPFFELSEWLGGYMIVKAESLDEAANLAHGCPALDANGSVEIRPIYE